MRLVQILLPVFACLFVSTAQARADSTGYTQQLQQIASDKVLWQHQEWLNLGHYQQSKIIQGKYSNSIDDDRFFYSPTGKKNPQAELNATLIAFFSTQETGNEHALCRSPARYNWLNKHLQINPKQLPEPDCSDYTEWRSHIHAESRRYYIHGRIRSLSPGG